MRHVVEVACSLGSLVLILWSIVAQPHQARCPGGWYVNGVDEAGYYRCRTKPSQEIPGTNARGGYVDLSVDHAFELRSRVYCTGGMIPVVGQDGEVVSCQAGWKRQYE